MHFIGKSYYSRGSFIREAKKYGITRRVALNVLKKMSWGDRVLLAIMDGKTPVIFGEFRIERISGLSSEVMKVIAEKGLLESQTDPGGIVVRRGCGSYVAGPTYSVRTTIEQIAKIIENEENPGKPMVGGKFIPHPLVRLKDLKFRQGFRLFNYEAFAEAYKAEKEKAPLRTIPAVRGLFYVKEMPKRAAAEGAVQSVDNYERAAS